MEDKAISIVKNDITSSVVVDKGRPYLPLISLLSPLVYKGI
jgi:hypothetical protein